MKTGIIAGIFIVVVITALKKVMKHTCDYDERQLNIRGKAYQYGFLTVQILLAMALMISLEEDIPEWLNLMNTSIVIFSCGMAVFAGYSVYKDAFIPLHINGKRFIVLYAIVFIMNATAAYSSIKVGNNAVANICMCLLFGSLFCALLLKQWSNKEQ